MVTWLTPDYGKVVTVVKGACRPKSAFLGQYDLFYTCDLLFYRRDHDGVHAIRECEPIDLREPLRGNWRQATAAAYLADLTARVTPEHQSNRALYSLFSQTLDGLAYSQENPSHKLILGYEINLLRHLGVLPDFTTCPLCHTPDRTWLRFSLPSGRFLCKHTGTRLPNEATLPVHRDVQSLFLSFCGTDNVFSMDHLPFALASNKNDVSSNLLFGLSRFLGMFIAFHLDVPSAVRRVALEMLNANHTQQTALLETSQT